MIYIREPYGRSKRGMQCATANPKGCSFTVYSSRNHVGRILDEDKKFAGFVRHDRALMSKRISMLQC